MTKHWWNRVRCAPCASVWARSTTNGQGTDPAVAASMCIKDPWEWPIAVAATHRAVCAVWTWSVCGVRDTTTRHAVAAAEFGHLVYHGQHWVPPAAIAADSVHARLVAAAEKSSMAANAHCKLLRVEDTAGARTAVFQWCGVFNDATLSKPYTTAVDIHHVIHHHRNVPRAPFSVGESLYVDVSCLRELARYAAVDFVGMHDAS